MYLYKNNVGIFTYADTYTQNNAYQNYLGVPNVIKTKHEIQDLKTILIKC